MLLFHEQVRITRRDRAFCRRLLRSVVHYDYFTISIEANVMSYTIYL